MELHQSSYSSKSSRTERYIEDMIHTIMKSANYTIKIQGLAKRLTKNIESENAKHYFKLVVGILVL